MNSATDTGSGSCQVQSADRGPPVSDPGQGSHHRAMSPLDRQSVGHPTPMCGTTVVPSLSLSHSPIKGVPDQKCAPLAISCPSARWDTARRSPPASHPLALPFLFSFRVANPWVFAVILLQVSPSLAHSSAVHLGSWEWPLPVAGESSPCHFSTLACSSSMLLTLVVCLCSKGAKPRSCHPLWSHLSALTPSIAVEPPATPVRTPLLPSPMRCGRSGV
jgi:hypothetical protein